LQVIGRPFDEETVFAVSQAAALERAAGVYRAKVFRRRDANNGPPIRSEGSTGAWEIVSGWKSMRR
jgi:hypothetical protein